MSFLKKVLVFLLGLLSMSVPDYWIVLSLNFFKKNTADFWFLTCIKDIGNNLLYNWQVIKTDKQVAGVIDSGDYSDDRPVTIFNYLCRLRR